MTTKNPRINVVLEDPIYGAVKQLSGRNKVSMSMVIRDMVKEELERYEDSRLSEMASARDNSLKKRKTVSHKDVWK